MKISALSVLVALGLHEVVQGANLLERLPELASTGLSGREIERLGRADCSNGTSYGTYASPTYPSAWDLKKRNAFVKRDGINLSLAGKPFRATGGSIYWLGLDENVVPDPSYPSRQRVIEAFGDMSAMRATAVRGHTLGVSFGNPLSVEPALDVFNEEAYEPIDFAILVARIYGIKLLIPLVDNYNWYHGGKYQFIGWHGINFTGTGSNISPPDVGAYFYNTTTIVDSFHRYVTRHLNHVNQYTGIAYKDDPTIFGWESGNELSAVLFGDGPAPPAWTKSLGTLIKSLAPNHLFMDGTYGIYTDTAQLSTEIVDIFSDHFYPANITKLQTGVAAVHKAGRSYFAGEYDWVGNSGGDPVPSFLSAIEAEAGIGSAFWSLFGHDDECCNYVLHDDGFSLYYPGMTEDMEAKVSVVVNHLTNMNKNNKPEILPQVSCPRLKGSIPAAIAAVFDVEKLMNP